MEFEVGRVTKEVMISNSKISALPPTFGNLIPARSEAQCGSKLLVRWWKTFNLLHDGRMIEVIFQRRKDQKKVLQYCSPCST